jgi:ribonuclease T1
MCHAATVMRRAMAAVFVGALLLGGCATATSGPVADQAADPARSSQSEYADLAPAEPTSDLPTMTVAELPAEGIDTLALIEAGGPFPYDKDGATFQNREGLLPPAPKGFYAEYTVITPGEDDRGARRVVAADDGGRFYTDDHYSSFREVVSG